MATIPITYLFDPLCGWCYGAAPVLEQIARLPEFEIQPAATGLFAGPGARPVDDGFAAYAWSNDERIARLSGQPFSEAYRRIVLGDRSLLFDSGPATLALAAVGLTAPGRTFDVLRAIQGARYVEGRDITDIRVLAQILIGLELADSADRLVDPDDALLAAYRSGFDSVRSEMRRFGAGGVPALIVGQGEHRRLIQAAALFGSMDALLDRLKAA